ncbi:hypothetical protein [Amycolatopsis viridis]|uniref:Secreted protein n=1 Tax=Amycolatopsis viridis TaxID=185678 RepID=A0ABX0T0I3_9PSEU|nr:hypothetical protein [Amycolatopsis viridis]NIH82742.1 hypothetical protein [Amycolatopsis viridis]
MPGVVFAVPGVVFAVPAAVFAAPGVVLPCRASCCRAGRLEQVAEIDPEVDALSEEDISARL